MTEIDYEMRNIKIGVTFPLQQFKDWDKDCKDNFADNRSSKMLFDHNYRNDFSKITNLVIQHMETLEGKIYELEQRCVEFESRLIQENEKEEVLTFA